MAPRRESASALAETNSHQSKSTRENPNVFDDSYAIDGSESINSELSGDQQSRSSSPSADLPESSAVRQVTACSSGSIPRPPGWPLPPTNRLSRKPIASRDVRSSMLNAQSTRRPPSTYSQATTADDAALPQRTSSSASSLSYGRAQSPFQGASAPSHPYSMYPQSLGRSSSVATSSTIRAPTQAVLQAGPSHPYALYDQNASLDPDEESSGYGQQSIPVGFTGQGHNYQRRIGPEGEELDMIGPDGHTEQLPPYSRYPEQLAPKFGNDGGLPSIGENPAERISSADTLVLNTFRNPQPRRAGDTEASSLEATTSSNGPGTSEKSWGEKSWKEKRNTRLCGWLRIWVLLITIGIVLLVAAIAVGVTFYVEKITHNIDLTNNDIDQFVTVTKTTLQGATPISTSVSLSSLPTGTYSVPLGPAHNVENTCLVDSDQSPAWSCSLTGPGLNISIVMPNGNLPAVASTYGNASLFDLSYGAVPPQFTNQVLEMVYDNSDLNRGPALHFQALYDKAVIVEESYFTYDPDMKRASSNFAAKEIWSGSISPRNLQETEKIWYCLWNGTFLAGFIFMDEYPVDQPDADRTTASSTQTTSSMYDPSASPGDLYPPLPSTTMTELYTSSGTPSSKRQAADVKVARQDSDSGPFPSYPSHIILADSRLPNCPLPTCVLKLVMNDGTLQDYPENSPHIITLSEQDPPAATPKARRKAEDEPIQRKRQHGSCQCVWETT